MNTTNEAIAQNNKSETNRLIAEFMGLSYCEKYHFEGWYTNHEHNYRICDFDGLKYHKDWNWLMEVVEKIESLNDNGYDFDIFSDGVVITQYRVSEKVDLNEGLEVVRLTNAEISFTNKKEVVYNACLEFIKWKNSVS